MTTTLVTGANKGLGLEACRRLIAEGHAVWLAARSETKGRAAAAEIGARFVQLDVTDDESVKAAASTVGQLDVLINNAGIGGEWIEAEATNADDLREVFETHVFGVVRVMHAFLPLLATPGVVVNVSSGLGSLALTNDPQRMEHSATALGYPASKCALNMLTSQYAKSLPRLRINAVDPGYTATDLTGNQGTQTVKEGTDAIVRLALLPPDGPTGQFFDRHGPLAW